MNNISWSPEQAAIFGWFETPTESRNLIVQARAGTGKTTTIREAFSFAPESQIVNNTLYCVFNKKNQLEAEDKMKHLKVQVKTLHGLGFAYVKRLWCSAVPDDDVEFDRARYALGSDCKESIIAIVKLVGFAKNVCIGVPTVSVLAEIAQEQDLVDGSRLKLISLAAFAREAMTRATERDSVSRISFNDMVWLPTAMGIVKPWYSMVVIDEAQDMSAPQLLMARQSCKLEGRIVCVGDDRQAIYAFRGAAKGGMETMRDTLKAQVLPLTVTRRCPKAVVALAQKTVPDYRAADDAPEGKVESVGHTNASVIGDVILSRLNAPLMPLALSLLRRHIPARIEGRDIGKQLTSIVKSTKAKDAHDFTLKIDAWKAKNIERLMAQKSPEKKIENIKDIAETLLCVAEGCVTVYDIETRIGNLFDDTNSKSKPAVTLSTVHKAKGLEWNRVFILSDTFGRNKWADPWEEANIHYVAITRTKSELYLVSSQQVESKLESEKSYDVENKQLAEIKSVTLTDLKDSTVENEQLTKNPNLIDSKESNGASEASKGTKSQPDDQSAPESIQSTPLRSVVRLDSFDLCAGHVRLTPSDVIMHDSTEHVCIGVNASCARIQCLAGGKTARVSLRGHAGIRTEVEFKSKPVTVSIANQIEPKRIIRRMSADELNNFLTGKRSTVKNQVKSETKESDDMSKKKEKTKAPKRKKSATPKVSVSYAGRGDFIRKLKKDGFKFDAAMVKIKDKYPGSSPCNCNKVWSSNKATKAIKPVKAGKKSAKSKSLKKKKVKCPTTELTSTAAAAETPIEEGALTSDGRE